MALARFYPKFIHWIVLRSPACIQPANPFHHVFFYILKLVQTQPTDPNPTIEKVFSEELPVDHEEIEFHQLCIIYMYIYDMIYHN